MNRKNTLQVTALLIAYLLLPAGVTGAAQPKTGGFGGRDGRTPAATVVVYQQPPHPSGGLILSSLRDPDGSDLDQWVWDAFTLPADTDILDARWTGGYDPKRGGMGGKVAKFVVSFYKSIGANTQPDLLNGLLARYELTDNAGETPGPVIGGIQMYDYAFSLPAAFRASGDVKYWIQIEAYQGGAAPDWGLTRGTGGDGLHFRKVAGETVYQHITGDTSFALLAAQAAPRLVYLPCLIR